MLQNPARNTSYINIFCIIKNVFVKSVEGRIKNGVKGLITEQLLYKYMYTCGNIKSRYVVFIRTYLCFCSFVSFKDVICIVG